MTLSTTNAWRRFFVKVTDGRRSAHLHVMTSDSPRWHQQIAFRDALRADPILTADYAALKRVLAAKHTDDDLPVHSFGSLLADLATALGNGV